MKKYIKNYSEFVNHKIMESEENIFSSATASNYKQANAILAINKRQSIDYDYQPEASGETEYTKKIEDFLIENGFDYKIGSNKHSFYFTNKIPCGDVRGYKNCAISHVDISSIHAVCFHITFEIENPFLEKVEEIKQEMKKYEGLSEEEWSTKVEEEFQLLLKEESKYDCYIPNFTYCYSQSLNPNVIKNIYEIMIKPENLEKSEKISKLYDEIMTLRYKVTNGTATYAEKVKYWDLMDEQKDMTEYNNPTDDELLKREQRRNKTEEDEKRENDIANDILAKLLKDK